MLDKDHWFIQHNPLLNAIPKFSDVHDVVTALTFFPLEGLDVSALNLVQRYALLACDKTPLCPTTQSASAAMIWYGMLIGGLQTRNPLRAEARARYWALLNAIANGAGAQDVLKAPVAGISVHVTKGPAGTGKTVTAKHFCRMLGPQYIDHGSNPEAGWNGLRQLVYLFADLSHDGTRGGFVYQLLMQLDQVLGTNYRVELPRRARNVDALLVEIAGRLIAHFTGILFIDEAQLRNLILSGQADLVQMMLLQLMNAGFPIVILGNECAFDWIKYSQDQTRLNLIPPIHFPPVGAIDHPDVEADWAALCRGISSYYVLPKPILSHECCNALLRTYSGGIGRVGLTLFCTAQFNVLAAARDYVTPQDITDAYQSPLFDNQRPLVDGFSKRLPELLLGFPDVNAAFYARAWGKPSAPRPSDAQPSTRPPEKTSPPSETNAKTKPSKARRQSGPTKLKAELTRKAKEQAARDNLSSTLPDEDMRQKGMVAMQLKGLAAVRQRIESQGV